MFVVSSLDFSLGWLICFRFVLLTTWVDWHIS